MGTPKKNAWRAIYPIFLLDFAILIWESRTHGQRRVTHSHRYRGTAPRRVSGLPGFHFQSPKPTETGQTENSLKSQGYLLYEPVGVLNNLLQDPGHTKYLCSFWWGRCNQIFLHSSAVPGYAEFRQARFVRSRLLHAAAATKHLLSIVKTLSSLHI